MSAHQFSANNVSVQADEEEKLDADMLSQNADLSPDRPIGSRGS